MTLVGAIAGGLLVATAVVGTAAPAQAAAGTVTLTATSTKSVLAGQPTTVTLTATNPSTTNEYNAGFQYTLPAGATYTAPTTPSSAGEPSVATITDGNGSHEVLVWANVSDLVAGDTSTISFGVTADPTVFPVGSNITGSAAVYTSEDARTLPVFDPTTGLATGGYDDSATTAADPTKVTALTIDKSEPSPEHELMRGVHDHPTVYKLVVTNTAVAATKTVTVTDYLPAQLEFLECGGIDHTTGQAPEYAGAASLTATTADTHGNCITPQSVTTVTDPTGYDPGVYTKVVWSLGDFAANATRTIEYVAAIPQRANAAWPTTEPGGDTEAANLDNNTGASTRQIGGGQQLVNHAVAAGSYVGAVAPGTDRTVTAEDSTTVLATDLSIIKSVATSPTGGGAPVFTTGGTATYTLRLRSSEYESDSAMTITDVLDDGFCPAYPSSITPSGDPVPADCANTSGSALDQQATNATITAVAYDASTGKFTLTMTPTLGGTSSATMGRSYDSAANGTDITYTARMRGSYSSAGSSGPTSSGDSFGNTVAVAGTATPIHDTDTVPRAVTNGSGTSISTTSTQISKQVLSRTAGPISSAADCSTASQSLYSPNTDTASPFQLGDDVCFRLEVDFPSSIDTRNPSVTDYLPVGTTFVDAALPADSTFDASSFVRAGNTSDTTRATWNLGSTEGSNGRYVAGGSTLVFYVLANITKQGSSATKPDLVDNLMKFRQENTAGKVSSLRTSVGYVVAGAPTTTLDKRIVSRNGTPITPTTSTTTAEGQTLGYQLTVQNAGTAATGTNRELDDVVVWDALPVGVACSAVTVPADDAGTCGPAPTGAASTNPARNYLTWTIPSIAAGASATLSYTMTVPAGVSVSSSLVNDASVTRFTSPNTAASGGAAGATQYRTAASLDTSAPATTDGTAPEANASATASMPAASVLKTGASVPNGATNVSGPNGVQGEGATYTYTAVVPAHATVFNATLRDTLPSGITAGTGTTVSVTDPSGAVTTTPWGTASTFTSGGSTFTITTTGGITFPAAYDNQTDTAQDFAVTLTGVTIAPTAPLGALRNTATFTSTATSATDSAAIPTSASATIAVVAPTPTIRKTASTSAAVGTGTTVTYTMLVGNSASVADAYDVLVVDCLPAGLTYVPGSLTNTAGTAPTSTFDPSSAPADANCTSGTTAYGAVYATLARGATSTLTLQATIDPDAAASAQYANTATITTSSLADDKRAASSEALQTASSSATVKVAAPTVDKTVTTANGTSTNLHTATAPAGDQATYSLTATIPANTNLYDALVSDALPAGMVRGTGAATVTSSDPAITGTELTPSTSGGITTIGFGLGSIASSSTARTVTITVPITVPVGAASGAKYANTAKLAWNLTEKAQPTTPTATLDQTVSSPTATVTATAPLLGIAKRATTGAPTPGSAYGYTLTVTNSGTSTAFSTRVTDTVPAGVVVAPGSISDGGSLSGQATDGSGGGTITWTGLDIATSKTLTYSATISRSDLLSGGALVNSAAIPSYRSLPAASGGGGTYSTAATTVSVTPVFPAVTLGKTAPTGPAYVGQSSPWSVTVTNAGSPASTVHVTDVLPANWTYDAGSARLRVGSGTAVAVDAPTITTAGGVQTLDWANLGSIAGAASPQLVQGSVWTLTYTATPTAAATTTPGAGHSVDHTNTVSAVVTDPSGATHTNGGTNGTSFVRNTATAVAHIDAADLAITKAAVATKPVAGAGASDAWTIVVRNTSTTDGSVGPFHVVDTPGSLPAGATVTGATGTGWTCVVTDGTVSCDTGAVTLAAGASLPTITVQLSLPSGVAAGTVVGNSAKIVGQHTFDPNGTNDSASADVTTAASADLAITKTGPSSADTGDTVQYTLAVTNAGPSDAAGPVAVDDAVPAGVTVTKVDGGAAWTCDAPSNTVHCVLADGLAANASVPAITVTGVVKSSTTGTIKNTATVQSPTTDPVAANNTSGTVSTTIGSATTLRVTKVLKSFTPGTTGSYEITVQNTGSADARTVSLTDALPDGLTLASSTSDDGWACTTDSTKVTVTCDLDGTLPAGQSATLALTVNVPAGIRDDVVNTATASADNAPDASGAATTSTTPLTELSIDKTDDAPGDLAAGQSFHYTIAVGNTGPSDIVRGDTTVVTDTLPVGETFVGAAGTGWTVTQDGRSLTFTSTSGVVVGAAFPTITISVVVDADTAAGTLVNEATVTSSAAAHSASDTDPVDVVTRAALTIDKALAPGSSTVAGTDATFTVTVANDGPSDARTVALTDLAPAGMTISKVTQTSGPTWTCSDASCTIAQLPSGDAGTSVFTVTGSIAASVRPSTLVNTATTTWTDSAGSSSATDTAGVDVVDQAALTMTKTAVDANGKPVTSVAAGNQVAWLLQVHNAGPSDADGPVTVTDHLPAGMTYVGLADTTIDGADQGWTCALDTIDPQLVSCSTQDGVLADTDAAPLVIATTIDPAETAGTTTNTAVVSSPTTAPSGTDGGAQGSVTVAPEANVAVTITHPGDGVIGKPVPATATVVNTGPSTATDVTATVTLPKGLTFQDTVGTDPAWTAGAPVVGVDGTTTIVFTLAGPLAPGQTAPPIVVTSVVTPGSYPSATIGATTATATPETTMADNTSSTAITIGALSSLSVTKTHTQALVRNHTVGYTITVTNAGPTSDPGPVTVTDALPDGLTFVSIDTRDAATCTTGATVVCTLDAPLAVDASVALQLTVKVAGNAPDRITNRAVVATPTVQVGQAGDGAGDGGGDGGSVGSDPLRASDPATVAADPAALAFTGSGSVLALVLFALLAVAGGAGLVVLRRRRPAGGAPRR